MDIPTGIITFGNQDFSDWIKLNIEKVDTHTFAGACADVQTVQSEVAQEKPRAVIIDLATLSPNEAGLVGGEVQRGFKWASVLFLFPELDENVLAFSKSVRRRRWSIAGRNMVDEVGLDRVLAGAFTDTGFVDSSISAYETELYERSLESTAEGESSEEDEEDMDEAV